jgi:uncharacterized damage-inducible protein DinB
MPDTTAYLEHIRSLSGGEDPLAIMEAAPATVSRLVAQASDQQLRTPPQPGKWSVTQIIAHLAEDELVSSWRYRQMLENPGCTLAGFDQDKWAEYGRYDEWTAADALAMFKLLREANLRMLQRLTPEQWNSNALHAERGRMTVRDLAQHMAGHDLNHIGQIRRILGRE